MRAAALFALFVALVVVTSSSAQDRTPPVAARLSTIERRLDAIEKRLAALERAPKGVPVRKPRAVKNTPITVKLLRKWFHKGDLVRGDAGDQLDFKLQFTSRLGKDVRAFMGAVVFKDLFGEMILSVSLKYTDGLTAKGTAVWEGGIEYKQFKDEHRTLRAAKQKDMVVTFEISKLIYSDGTRETFTQPK